MTDYIPNYHSSTPNYGGSVHTSGFNNSSAGRSLAVNRLFAMMVWLFVASGGFVLFEPSLFELLGVILIPIAFLCGFYPHPKHFILVLSSFMLIIAGVITFVVSPDLGSEWLRYHFITIFILLMTLFFARLAHERPHWVEKHIFPALMISGVLTALLGIAGYFGVAAELFTLYGRAKGAFKDPNVFAPYLIFPIVYCAASWVRFGILKSPHRYLFFVILLAGVFFSFSRAAWGITVVSMIVAIMMVLATNKQDASSKSRVIVLAIFSFIFVSVAVFAILSNESTAGMLTERLGTQEYDVKEGGRFDRYPKMFPLIFGDPWGKGHLFFGEVFGEDPHNSFLKMFISFGWLGGIAHLIMTLATFIVAIYGAARQTPWQTVSIALFATYLGITIESLIIDIDHWRVYYLLMGLIWGLGFAPLKNYRQTQFNNSIVVQQSPHQAKFARN